MVGVFRRSLSFPNKPNPNRALSRHTRSISLPCRSHPLISQLKSHVTSLQSWSATRGSSSASLVDGLTRLTELHHCLDDTLQLPQTQEALRRQPHSSSIENLLEHFLRFVDAYGIFRGALLSLKEAHVDAEVALRKKDESRVCMYLKARKKMSSEMSKLVNEIRQCIRSSEQHVNPKCNIVDVGDVELAGVVYDVVNVTVMVSVALFDGIAVSLVQRRVMTTWMRWSGKVVDDCEMGVDEIEVVEVKGLMGLRKKEGEEVKVTLKKMREMEACMEEIESCSERVFRSLINARVALLNTLNNY